MTTATTETNEAPVNIEEHARLVCGLLKEYTSKLASLNGELLAAQIELHKYPQPERMAWLLDQVDLVRQPLARVISRGSGLLEHSNLDSVTEDELAVRMREMDVHFHHAVRLAHELRTAIAGDRRLNEQVTKLRYAAGLNAMKGGPLRPNE